MLKSPVGIYLEIGAGLIVTSAFGLQRQVVRFAI